MKTSWYNVTQTKDGCPVRIYAVDGGGVFPIHGAIWLENKWILWGWDKFGNNEISLANKSLDPIPWEYLQDWIKFVAMDKDQKWFGYSMKPEMKEVNWTTEGSIFNLRSIKIPIAHDWTNSLEVRPTKGR